MATSTPNICESISNAHVTLYSEMAQASQLQTTEPEHPGLSHLQTVPMHQMPPQHFEMNFFMNDIIRRLNTIDCKVSKLDAIETGLRTVTERVGQVETSLDTVTCNQIELDKVVRKSDGYYKQVTSKVTHCETEIMTLKKQVHEEYKIEIDEMKKKSKKQDLEMNAMKTQIRRLQRATEDLYDVKYQIEDMEKENKILRNKVIDMQERSMRDNLIFTGINEDNQQNFEDTEKLVQDLIKNKLDIQEEIEIERIHRFGRRFGDRPRPIVVRFSRYKQRELIRKKARELKGTGYGIHEQYPHEIERVRKELYPVLRQARAWNNKAVLIKDKLYINNKLYVFPEMKEDGNGEIANIEDRWTISFVPDNRYSREDRFSESRTYKRRKINSTESATGGDVVDVVHQDDTGVDKEEDTEEQLITENSE